ncbi:MAG TPA: DNA polymerase IV [Propionibacteriaceae bacterium]|nr:DNA polymerase IV [Propionibacteriaceae bacterium]
MRREASVLHLDLDAFFASVEQRDKPSLRGKPVVVGGTGARGVVATASYEAREFGVRSAMPMSEARRRCPHAAFLGGRFGAYREASAHVMRILRELSPLVEPLSLDEAFVDLRGSSRTVDLTRKGLQSLVAELKAEIADRTGGLTASVGVATSKFVAKVASELAKPDGLQVVEPGTEVALLRPMPVGVIPGVGPVTQDRLARIGVRIVADLQAASVQELVQVVGHAHGHALIDLAFARDDRAVEPERESKSISVEDTFEHDLVDPSKLRLILDRDAGEVAARLRAARLFARTVTIKVRHADFTTLTRSRTLLGATDRAQVLSDVAQSLLAGVDTTGGIRLLGVGAAGLTDVLQEDLFAGDGVGATDDDSRVTDVPAAEQSAPRWVSGADVEHDDHGRGWVWGSGLDRVTVRFESRNTPPGRVRTFAVDDPALRLLS